MCLFINMKEIILICECCHKSFTRNRLYRNKRTFCSNSCSAIFNNKNRGSDWYKCNSNISGLEANNRKDEYSSFKYYLTKCKTRTKRCNENTDIDIKYLKKLWENQNGICPYTGVRMILPESTNHHQFIHSLKKASLDRIDSSKGYVKGNVEFVCVFINLAKNSYPKEEVLGFLKEIGSPSENRTHDTQFEGL